MVLRRERAVPSHKHVLALTPSTRQLLNGVNTPRLVCIYPR
jgi:hypothetical protein